ncbi:Domain of unknown function DUF4815 [uncultured Caudovirales phage]|uniref:DUF4815 domain-containing protein n=1 Tax=uncultured Caudovirales phage TaxID=2100421 RepID=A0A6J5MC43_9CAUD|nr:Domain of unknown function DUF4815 [uncultured Caudovirales phage]
MTTINTNQAPYFDDFTEGKKFYQILFRPGRAVQARELNQLQTLLKSQLERLGKYTFKDGSVVLNNNSTKNPVNYSNNIPFIKIPVDNFSDTEDKIKLYWLGKVIKNSSGLRAKIKGYKTTDSLNQVRFYLEYLNADTTNGTSTSFSKNQSISTEEVASITTTIVNDEYAIGLSSAVTVDESIYFYNGRFVLVDSQTLFISPASQDINVNSKWNNIPSVSVGLDFVESIVTSSEDDDLLDNATGTPNIGAPGADRLRISANLIQLQISGKNFLETPPQNYVQLVEVNEGRLIDSEVQSNLDQMGAMLATRTYDESGDYTVNPFLLQIKEFLRTSTVNGAHSETEFVYIGASGQVKAKEVAEVRFGMSPGNSFYRTELGGWMPGTSYNDPDDQTSFIQLCDKKLSAVIDPGKAYVRGFERLKTGISIVDFDKARATEFINNRTISTPLGAYVYVKNMYGGVNYTTHDTVDLYDAPIVSRGVLSGNKIGTARVLNIEYYTTDSGFYDSVSAGPDSRIYRMFLFDIQMLADKKFEQVKSFYSNNPTFTCDALLERFPLSGSVSKATRKVVLTGETTNAQKTITAISSTQNLRPGMFVSGTGIPSTFSVTITSIDSATQITISANATASGPTSLTFVSELNSQVGRDEFTIIGSGTLWRNSQTEILKAGDYVEVDTGQSTAKIYTVESNPTSDTILRLNQNISADSWIDGANISYLYTPLRSNSDNSGSGLVYSLPDSPVATIRGATADGQINQNVSDIKYSIRGISNNNGVGISANGSNKIIINPPTGAQFEDFNPLSYAVIILDHATSSKDGLWLQVLPYTNGLPRERTAEIKIANDGSLEIYLNSADANSGNSKFQIEFTLEKNAVERPKQLVRGSFTGVGGAYVSPGGSGAVVATTDVKKISLGKPDVLKITRVVMSPGPSIVPSDLPDNLLPSGHVNITGAYSLDNGQRDYYYDIASANLLIGSRVPTGQVRIEFDYFTHSGQGDYFSVNSYPFFGGTQTNPSITYSDIPTFNSSDGTNYDLANCIDFRPVVNDSGITSSTPFQVILGIPKENFTCDYHYYLGRMDKLFLSGKRDDDNFYVKYGSSSKFPVPPPEPDDGMVIYDLSVAPYTHTKFSVISTLRNNKRYTMKDIGKLESRISSLEYYTSLSLLEKDTNSEEIKDALGRDRFKNGFLVENFKDGTVGSDITSYEFKSTIDSDSGLVRPLVVEDSVRLFEKALLSSDPAAARTNLYEYQKTGDLFTLPYTKVVMAQQLKASKTLNVNPYQVFVYIGNVSITPWTDEWRETSIVEPVNITDSRAYDAARKTFEGGSLSADGQKITRIDYTVTRKEWTGVDISKPRYTGKKLLKFAGAGTLRHIAQELAKKSGKPWETEYRQLKTLPTVMVPYGLGWANEGQPVPITLDTPQEGDKNRRNWMTQEFETVSTMKGREITEAFGETFEDKGWDTISLGSKIIGTSLVQYMRSKEINFTGKAFMPQVRVYPFFNGVNVSAHCKPTGGSYGDPLICDERGRVSGIFKIPDPKTNSLRFETGDKMFRLTTSSINSINPAPDSAGEARYTARGWIDISQETTQSTRLFTISNTTTRLSSKPISEVISRDLTYVDCPHDPIAQSFWVEDSGGCFMTHIDVYFESKPWETLPNGQVNPDQPPVTLQIRELGDQGYPSNRVLPFGEVVKEAAEVVVNKIDTNAGTITVYGYRGTDTSNISATPDITGPWRNGEFTSENSSNPEVVISTVPFVYGTDPSPHMVPTRFTFASPIYLRQKGFYCFVLIANGIEYKVWISESGPDTDSDPTEPSNNVEIGTRREITTDPYLPGNIFKSQQGITWNAYQRQDMKFKIWKARFDTSKKGEVYFVNEELPKEKLTTDPFNFSSGSTLVRVTHPGHGHTTARVSPLVGSASKVVFSPEYNAIIDGLTSFSNNITIQADSNLVGILTSGSFILNPNSGEQRRVSSVTSSTIVLDRAFEISQLSSSDEVSITTYSVPSGNNLAGIPADCIYDYRGFDVQNTELDSYIIDLSTRLDSIVNPVTKTATTSANTLTLSAGQNTSGLEIGMVVSGTGITEANGIIYITNITQPSTITLSRNVDSNQGTSAAFQFTLKPIASGFFGGNKVISTDNKRFEELNLITTPLVVNEDTTILWNMTTTSSCGVNDSTTSTYQVQPGINFLPNDDVVFNNPMMVCSYINELPSPSGPSTVTSNLFGDRKSLQIKAVLKSSNPNLSPIVDSSRMTAFLTSNRLDDPKGVLQSSGDYVINSVFDNYVVLPTTANSFPVVTAADIANKLRFSSSSTTATGKVSSGTTGGITNTRTIVYYGSPAASTKFLSEISVGDIIKTSQNETRRVVNVVSDTELTVDTPITLSFSNADLYISPPNLTIKTADVDIAKHLSNLDVGKYLTITGATGTRNFSDAKILKVDYTPNNTVNDSELTAALPNSGTPKPKLLEITVDYKCIQPAGIESSTGVKVLQKDRFVDEIAPVGGSCGSKFVSKKLTLARPSNALKIIFDAYRDQTCNIDLYYRLETGSTGKSLDTVNWTKADFNVELNGVLVTAIPSPNEYLEYSSTINNLPAFTAAQVKIVMRGGNPARSIRIRNFRMIALDD